MGEPISDEEAIAMLQNAVDIVACGNDGDANDNKARALCDAAFGASIRDLPHKEGGKDRALPHYHPKSRTPTVHAFYERPPRHKAFRHKGGS
jgi:hypothetical protein